MKTLQFGAVLCVCGGGGGGEGCEEGGEVRRRTHRHVQRSRLELCVLWIKYSFLFPWTHFVLYF